MEKFDPSDAPQKSDLEEVTEDRFLGLEINSEEDLDKAVKDTFHEVCGNNGEKEFFEHVVPTIKSMYGVNYRKAGLRLLEIIDKGAEEPVKAIGAYFLKSIPRGEVDFILDRERLFERMVKTVEEIILKKKEQFGEHMGVVAVLVYGSYANNTFVKGSDLDVIYILNSDETSAYIAREQKSIHYGPDFDSSLEKALGVETDNINRSVSLSDETKFRHLVFDEGNVINGKYIIITPYPEIRQKIEEILK